MPSPPTEVLPGVWHWRCAHPTSGFEGDSYYLDDGGVLIDPNAPAEGLDWFRERPTAPTAIVLSCRLHWRASTAFRHHFDLGKAHVPFAGMHAFKTGERPAESYRPGDTLPGGLVAHEIGALAPDDTALHRADSDAVFFADGVVAGSGEDGRQLGFVPDGLMDDPAETKRGLIASLERLLRTTEFSHVLCAHGGPMVDDGRRQLEELVRAGGRTVQV